jgi:glutathione S-transferase
MTIKLYELVGSDATRPFSPHCWKAVMALAHKGLDWTSIPTPFTEVPAVEGGANIVPVIRDGGRVVADSFRIALYLEETYPDRPTLFGGEGGKAMARFVEGWTQTQLHSILGMAAIMDIHDGLGEADRAYLRASREARFGMTLEDARDKGRARLGELTARLEPLRAMLKHQPFLGGDAPLFPDYIVFGAFQWIRVTMPVPVLDTDDPVLDWFESLLDLHDGLARRVPAAA